jgi:hypothetical protein
MTLLWGAPTAPGSFAPQQRGFIYRHRLLNTFLSTDSSQAAGGRHRWDGAKMLRGQVLQ